MRRTVGVSEGERRTVEGDSGAWWRNGAEKAKIGKTRV